MTFCIQGNHGEDVKELYYYLDNDPNHNYMRAVYLYPQTEFPYKELITKNRNRTLNDAEYEILDTGYYNNITSSNVWYDIIGLVIDLKSKANAADQRTNNKVNTESLCSYIYLEF